MLFDTISMIILVIIIVVILYWVYKFLNSDE